MGRLNLVRQLVDPLIRTPRQARLILQSTDGGHVAASEVTN